jgi:fructooligosaccharide transport system permease protein
MGQITKVPPPHVQPLARVAHKTHLPSKKDITRIARRKLMRREKPFLLFIIPVVIFFLVFRYLPVLLGLWVSLWEYSLLSGYGDFTGLANYARALTDPKLLSASWITIVYAVTKVAIEIVLGIGIALLLQGNQRVRAFMRSVLFVPVVTSGIVVAVLWSMLYNSQSGLINSFLNAAGIASQPFLVSTDQALGSLIAMGVWNSLGLSVIIFVVGLGQIDQSLYEAAEVDGAGATRKFWHITLPGLRGPIIFVAAMHVIEAVQVFVPMYNMTKGGPEAATTSIALYVYEQGFEFGDMGYASAISMLVVIIIVGLSASQLWVWRKSFREN